MNYRCFFFLNHLPHVEEEVRIIDGREERCLIIPTKVNQIKKGKQGNWLLIFKMMECGPNERLQTHDIQLMYLTKEAGDKAKATGAKFRSDHMGRAYPLNDNLSLLKDWSNHAAELRCDGRICLSDIPKELIFVNSIEGKRYLQNLIFRPLDDESVIYSGVICVDDIPVHHIKQDLQTGKKYIDVIFQKLPKLDTYHNTHQLIIATKDGSEIEIGRFKEWAKKTPAPTPDSDNNQSPQSPSSIDGYKF